MHCLCVRLFLTNKIYKGCTFSFSMNFHQAKAESINFDAGLWKRRIFINLWVKWRTMGATNTSDFAHNSYLYFNSISPILKRFFALSIWESLSQKSANYYSVFRPGENWCFWGRGILSRDKRRKVVTKILPSRLTYRLHLFPSSHLHSGPEKLVCYISEQICTKFVLFSITINTAALKTLLSWSLQYNTPLFRLLPFHHTARVIAPSRSIKHGSQPILWLEDKWWGNPFHRE
jgi:hypothetical protein